MAKTHPLRTHVLRGCVLAIRWSIRWSIEFLVELSPIATVRITEIVDAVWEISAMCDAKRDRSKIGTQRQCICLASALITARYGQREFRLCCLVSPTQSSAAVQLKLVLAEAEEEAGFADGRVPGQDDAVGLL